MWQNLPNVLLYDKENKGQDGENRHKGYLSIIQCSKWLLTPIGHMAWLVLKPDRPKYKWPDQKLFALINTQRLLKHFENLVILNSCVGARSNWWGHWYSLFWILGLFPAHLLACALWYLKSLLMLQLLFFHQLGVHWKRIYVAGSPSRHSSSPTGVYIV